MSGTSAFTPSAMKVSNRGFIKQMKLHGWRERKVSGDDTEMVSPAGDIVIVRSAHTHTGNHPRTINKVLDIMETTWNDFMFIPTETDEIVGQVLRSIDMTRDAKDAEQVLGALDTVSTIKQSRRAERARRKADADRERQAEIKAERRAARHQREDTTVMPATTEVVRQRGIADAAFGVILAHSGPITNQQIADLLTDYDKTKVGSAANYLYNLGVIDRVKRGVWQRKHELSPHDMSVDVVSRNIDLIREQGLRIAPVATPPPAPATVTPIRETAPVIAAAPSADREEVLNDTLDLLFPNGFRASHLPAIENWKRATSALMDAIEGAQ